MEGRAIGDYPVLGKDFIHHLRDTSKLHGRVLVTLGTNDSGRFKL